MSVVLPVLRALPLSTEAVAPFGALLSPPAYAPSLERSDITFWNSTADLSGLAGSGVAGHLIARRRELTLTRIERHVHTPEAFIATARRSLMVVGAPGEVDPEHLRAFEISAGQAMLLRPGAWHWAPYPLSKAAIFLLILRAETSEHDIEMHDVPAHRLEPLAHEGSSSHGPSP